MTQLLNIRIVSFGFKYGSPVQSNLLYDVRFVKNPYYEETLRPLTGADKPVADFILGQAVSRRFLRQLKLQLRDALRGYLEHGHDHETVVIAFGCTGGKHRSVCFALQCKRIVRDLSRELSISPKVAVLHRDLGRE